MLKKTHTFVNHKINNDLQKYVNQNLIKILYYDIIVRKNCQAILKIILFLFLVSIFYICFFALYNKRSENIGKGAGT